MDQSYFGFLFRLIRKSKQSGLSKSEKGLTKRNATSVKDEFEYLRFPLKATVDYFILHSILVYSCVIFLIFFAMNKRRRTNDASLLN